MREGQLRLRVWSDLRCAARLAHARRRCGQAPGTPGEDLLRVRPSAQGYSGFLLDVLPYLSFYTCIRLVN